jgi:hypothetical protein
MKLYKLTDERRITKCITYVTTGRGMARLGRARRST